MNDQTIQQLIYRAGRWPWCWFKLFREAAAIADNERCRFNVLMEEHHLVKIEASELHAHRRQDAERHQELRDEHQALKRELAELQKLLPELNALKEERTTLITQHKQMKDGVATLFEFIRRNKVNDDRGREIPSMPLFPNVFRQ